MRRTPEVFGSRENTNKHGCNGRLQHIFSSSSYTGGVLHLHILPRPAFNRYRRAYHQVSCFLQLLSIQQVAKKRGPKPPGTSFTVTSAAPPCHPCVVTSRARLFSQPFGAAEALFLALFRAAGTSSFNLSMRSRDRHLPMHHPRAHFGKKKNPSLVSTQYPLSLVHTLEIAALSFSPVMPPGLPSGNILYPTYSWAP